VPGYGAASETWIVCVTDGLFDRFLGLSWQAHDEGAVDHRIDLGREIFDSVEQFYRRFYLRSGKIAAIVSEMIRSPQMMKRCAKASNFFTSCASAVRRTNFGIVL
jgi:hypothetical protein